MRTYLSRLAATLLMMAQGAVGAAVLTANTTSNNGLGSGSAIFFDLEATAQDLRVTHLTTGNTAPVNGAFNVEVFTRSGTAMGGNLANGPGSSTAGWTSLGTAPATQGLVAEGISLLIDIPDIDLALGQLTGVALRFTGAGSMYFGTDFLPSSSVFSDSLLTMTVGEARTVPFTQTGSLFTRRGLTGSLTYEVREAQVPVPGTLALLGLALTGLAASRRRTA